MSLYSPSIEKLIESFEKLPSIGHKTAARLAFYILNSSEEETNQFVSSRLEAKKNLALNISNSLMKGKFGNEESLIEEYMDVYNKSYSYNANKIKEQPNYFYTSTENDLLTKETTDEFNTRKSR